MSPWGFQFKYIVMKRTIVFVLAVLSLAACVQDKIDSGKQSEAITFGSSFVEYATRATVTDESNLSGFNVWGYMNNVAAPVFEGTEVEKISGVWSYNDGEDKYWVPGQVYYFAALAPMNSSNVSLELATTAETASKGLGTLTFTNAAGEEDLIYSKYKTTSQPSNNAPVAFEFKHLLSKVRISFENQMANDYINVKVSNVKMSAPKSASIDLTSETMAWGTPTAHDNFDFNEIAKVTARQKGSTYELFMIPASDSYEYDLMFDVTLFMDGVEKVLYTASKTAKITGTALEVGSAYNFSAVITPNIVNEDVVSFEVEHVQNWDEFTQYSQLAVASKLGGEITLAGDVTVSSTIDVVADLTINLNGQTLTYNGTGCMFNVLDPATLTINGVDDQGNAIAGSAVVSTTSGAVIATANAGASIIINGGDHKTAGTTVYDTDGGTITLKIGSFYMWDPRESEGVNFPEGVIVVENGDGDEIWYDVMMVRNMDVSNTDELGEAINIPYINTINITENINYGSQLWIENRGELTINLNENTLTGNVQGYTAAIVYNSKLTFNGGTIVSGFQVAYPGSSLTLNDCTVKVNSTKSGGRYCVYAIDRAVVTINGGKYELNFNAHKDKSYVHAGSNAVVYINGGTFGPASPNTAYPPLYEKGGEIIVSGGTFGFDPTNWLADGYEAVKSGSTWTVQPIAQ